jgi:prophage regulatory protein
VLRILRLPEVAQRVNLSREQIAILERVGQFPHRVSLSPRAVGWIEHEIDRWIQDRMAERDNAVKAEERRVARMPPGMRYRYRREGEDKPVDAIEGDLPPAARHRRRLEREGADVA